ncbi:nucleoside deaminase [Nitrosomonas sp. Nm166]|uniref:nucleoside deaminase n=1 Tax=Nitrosomonas sp. Nm166 TaxID=1881054 RepID=UPI0008E30B4F|nr:nucleoside deaminase [Nitrosomonas sp. Nm166]SFD94351.1 Cytidine and deoxycytidylate deaminase zinc-binding region [Nitrosomonas sp. Nm166]
MTTAFDSTADELQHLHRCVELATEALEAGDEPFGSMLVAADGAIFAEDRNRVVSAGDRSRHPEFELARWAVANMTAEERAAATVFTSGEHCPMCSAAHGWVGWPHRVCELFRTARELACRAWRSCIARARLGNRRGRPCSCGRRPGSWSRGAGARAGSPLL